MTTEKSSFGESEQESARTFMLQHKVFLKAVCDIANQRQLTPLLSVAEDSDLNCLAYVLYLVSQHKIPLKEVNEIVRRKKYPLLRDFMRKSTDYDHFKSLERADKIAELKALGFAIKLALNPLFYRYTKPATAEDQGVDAAARLQQQLADGVKSSKT